MGEVFTGDDEHITLAKSGQQVKVCGMWTGDFIGVVTSVGFTQASFKVQAVAGGVVKEGDTVTFPYGQYLRVVEV